MDTKLARYLLEMNVISFGDLGTCNKNDSRSVIFDPRNLLSDPEVLKYIGEKMANVIMKECRGNVIVGLATAGIAFGAVASVYAGLPFWYLRSEPKLHLTLKWVEGLTSVVKKPKIIVIDELLFNGSTKKKAVEQLKKLGYEVTDVIVAIDRQLQKKADGPDLETLHQVKLHSLITMEEIVAHLVKQKKITPSQLVNLKKDYQEYERWYLPKFAQGAI
jgi:orotate phosphoribosyltransferase